MPISKRSISIIVSLAIFVVVILATNAYQYLKIKNDITSNVIKAIGANEQKKILTFFQSIEEKLNLVFDWGKNGLLDLGKTKNLNRHFFPLIQHEARFSGLVMADETGREYFLNRQEDEFLVRTTSPDGTMQYQLWADAETPGEHWEKKNEYSPVNRPWFKPGQGPQSINWTQPYTFYHTQEEGVTASLSWENTAPQPIYTVFGIDVLLSSLQQLLKEATKESPVDIFLVNSRNNTFLTSEVIDTGNDKKEDHLSTVLNKAIAKWKSADQPIATVIAVPDNEEKWLISLQPLTEQPRSTTWIGAAATEQVLLNSLDKSLYLLDITDVVVVLITGTILLGYLWKSGALRSKERGDLDPRVRFEHYLHSGEGATIEFKSSVRKNLKTENFGKEIELAWLKAVVGFLNTDGGALLLGVDDDGRFVGIEADDFENSDRCLLHVKNLIHQHIGAEFSQFITATMIEIEEREGVMVECKGAADPVFLRIGKNEEYYIRSGPSSTKLSPSQLINYVLQKQS